MAVTFIPSTNLTAFLATITYSELGPAIIAGSDFGFNVLVGSTPTNIVTFPSYADHPRIAVPIPSLGIESTAAGAFQILERYFDVYRAQLKLPDFSPDSQRKIAIRMIDERNALPLIKTGQFDAAIIRCSSTWASLPGAPYGQHTNDITALQAHYIAQGGTLSADC